MGLVKLAQPFLLTQFFYPSEAIWLDSAPVVLCEKSELEWNEKRQASASPFNSFAPGPGSDDLPVRFLQPASPDRFPFRWRIAPISWNHSE